MSLRIEQYRALKMTNEFLFEMLDPKKTPRVPGDVRRRASHCLRHYPVLRENGEPMFSRDCIGIEHLVLDSKGLRIE